MTTPLTQLQMLPSQSGHVYLPEKSAFLLGVQLSKAAIIVLGHVFMVLAAISSALAVLGAGNSNGHCSNFQGFLGCADLLSQLLTEWTFYFPQLSLSKVGMQ